MAVDYQSKASFKLMNNWYFISFKMLNKLHVRYLCISCLFFLVRNTSSLCILKYNKMVNQSVRIRYPTGAH